MAYNYVYGWYMGRVYPIDVVCVGAIHVHTRCVPCAPQSCRGHAANATSGASCVEEILVHQGRQLSMGVQAEVVRHRFW